MGAGFGGSILALVERGHEAGFAEAMKSDVIFCATADGAYVHQTTPTRPPARSA
jgi:galactokinase